MAVPLRHGVHWPHDSCSKKRIVLRAAPIALSWSESTTTAAEPMKQPYGCSVSKSSGILPASLANIPLDFDTLQPYGCFIGSAAVVVLSDHDSAIGAARNTMRFFERESCGQCTPCRNGTAKASLLMASDLWDLPLLADLSLVMRDASICGLGQAAPNPIDCVVKYFPQELGIQP